MLSPPPPLWTPPSFPLRTPTIAHVPMFDDLVVQYRKWNWKSQDYWFRCILSGSNSLGFQCQGRWQKIFNYKRFLAELLMASEYTGTRRFLIALRSKGWMQSRQVSEGWMKSLMIGIQQIKATQDIRAAWIILNNQWGWRKSHLGNCIECRLDLCYSAATIKKGSICKKDSWRIFVQPQNRHNKSLTELLLLWSVPEKGQLSARSVFFLFILTHELASEDPQIQHLAHKSRSRGLSTCSCI
jgi:hypothetical protein